MKSVKNIVNNQVVSRTCCYFDRKVTVGISLEIRDKTWNQIEDKDKNWFHIEYVIRKQIE